MLDFSINSYELQARLQETIAELRSSSGGSGDIEAVRTAADLLFANLDELATGLFERSAAESALRTAFQDIAGLIWDGSDAGASAAADLSKVSALLFDAAATERNEDLELVVGGLPPIIAQIQRGPAPRGHPLSSARPGQRAPTSVDPARSRACRSAFCAFASLSAASPRPARLSAAAPCGVAEQHPAAPCHGQRLLGPLGDRLALGLRHQRHDADGGVVHLRARVFGPSEAAMNGSGCRRTGTVAWRAVTL